MNYNFFQRDIDLSLVKDPDSAESSLKVQSHYLHFQKPAQVKQIYYNTSIVSIP